MNRNNNARSNARSNAPKPFCKVCKDAGKSEKEYTSHSVKSYDRLTGTSVTTCPTLLSQECRYCHEVGHTAKYCQALAEKKKYDEEMISVEKQPTAEKKEKIVAKHVSFAVLAYDSDEEEVKPTPKPVVAAPKPVTTAAKPVLTGWAAIAAKPVQVVKPVEPASVFTELCGPTRSQPSDGFGLTPVPAWVPPILTRSETLGRPAPSRIRRSWADDTSSDEEDDVDRMMDGLAYDPTW